MLNEDDSSNQMRFATTVKVACSRQSTILKQRTVNRRSTYVYNDDGHLLRIDVDNSASLDEGVDGSVDETETFTTVCD